MKILKKFSVLLLTVLIIATTTMTCFASVTPAVTEVNAGKTATVTLDYKNIAGIRGTLSLTGDDIIKSIAVEVINDDNVDGSKKFDGTYNKTDKILAYFSAKASDFKCALKVTIADNALAGDECKITFKYETTVDGKMPNVPEYKYEYATIKVVVDCTALNAQIKEAEKLNESEYTAATWKPFKEALNAAIAARNAKTQAEVDKATKTLKDAMAALEKKPVAPTVNYDELNATIKEAQKLNESDYTAATWKPFKEALDAAIAAKTATTQKAVDDATKALKDAMSKLEKKPVAPTVNYDELNAAIKEAEKLNESDYTAATWKPFADALKAAKEARNATTQSAVDAATKALKDAMNKLEKKPVAPTVNYDELNATIKEAEKLNESDYTEESWKPFKEALDKAIAAKTATTQKEVDDATGALKDAMSKLEKKPPVVPVNYDMLNAVIKVAQDHKESDYTEESWKPFKEALDKAIAAREATTQKEVDDAAKALSDAMNALVKKPVVVPVNYDELNALIDAAQKLNESDYTEESWKPFKEALDKAIAAKTATTQAEVDAAAKALSDAMAALKTKPGTPINYDVLNAHIEIAQSLKEEDYTAESWKVLKDALEKAIAARNATTQAEVDAATAVLSDAIVALVRKPIPEEVDYTKLNDQIEIAKSLKKENYTKKSWKVLEEALKEAIAALEAGTQAEVDAATAKLKAAIEALELKSVTPPDAGDALIVFPFILLAAAFVALFVSRSKRRSKVK